MVAKMKKKVSVYGFTFFVTQFQYKDFGVMLKNQVSECSLKLYAHTLLHSLIVLLLLDIRCIHIDKFSEHAYFQSESFDRFTKILSFNQTYAKLSNNF